MQLDHLPIVLGWMLAIMLFRRSASAQRPSMHWLITAGLMLAAALPLPALMARLSTGHGAANYNFAELFRTDKILVGPTFVLLFLLTPLIARWAADSRTLKTKLGWAAASCLIAWGLLRRSVTVESIHDILGSPVYADPLDLEYILRFAALYLPLLWLPMFCTFLAMRRLRTKGVLLAGFSIGLILATPLIIRYYSPSDNVPELFRPYGGCWFALLILLTVWSALLARRAGIRLGPLVMGLACVSAWWLLNTSIRVSNIHGVSLGFPMFAGIFVAVQLCILPVAPQRVMSDVKTV